MCIRDSSYAAGCVVSASEPAGAQVDVGTVITVYIAADPSVDIKEQRTERLKYNLPMCRRNRPDFIIMEPEIFRFIF